MSAVRQSGHQSGVILVAVLLAVAIMSVMVVAAVALTRSGIGSERLEQRRLSSHFALRSGIEAAKALILAMPPEERLALDGSSMQLDLGNGVSATIMMRDAAGLADLNRSDPTLIETVASSSGLPRGKAEGIAATITRLRKDAAPESGEKKVQIKPAQPGVLPGGNAAVASNAAETETPPIIFLAVEQFVELFRIPLEDGVRLAANLTIYNPTGKINPLAAPVPVLQSIPGVSVRDVSDVAAARASGTGSSDARLQQLVQRLPGLMSMKEPSVFMVEVRIDSGEGVLTGSTARAVLRLNGKDAPPFGVLALEEE